MLVCLHLSPNFPEPLWVCAYDVINACADVEDDPKTSQCESRIPTRAAAAVAPTRQSPAAAEWPWSGVRH